MCVCVLVWVRVYVVFVCVCEGGVWGGLCGVCVLGGGRARGSSTQKNTPVSGSGCGEEEERQEEAGDDED